MAASRKVPSFYEKDHPITSYLVGTISLLFGLALLIGLLHATYLFGLDIYRYSIFYLWFWQCNLLWEACAADIVRKDVNVEKVKTAATKEQCGLNWLSSFATTMDITWHLEWQMIGIITRWKQHLDTWLEWWMICWSFGKWSVCTLLLIEINGGALLVNLS